jgi:hypothetical protein
MPARKGAARGARVLIMKGYEGGLARYELDCVSG